MNEYIKKQLPVEELLCQLAEEGAELSKAALKLRRVIDGTNPTPVKFEEAMDNLREEIADVMLCLRMLDTDPTHWTYREIMDTKTRRWAQRLKAARQEEGHGQTPEHRE